MERRLFIFRPGQTLFVLSLLVALLFGCGGGGGSSGGTNPPPNNPPPGGGNPGTPNTDPPSVVSAAPQGNSVSVSAFIEITFDKSMDVATFQGGLEGLGNIGYAAVCVDADCKIIRLSRTTNLEYDFSYTLTLLAQVRDKDGNLLASPYEWSFKTAPFIPPPTFSSMTVDGKQFVQIGDEQVEVNTGECTAIAIDSSGTIHIAYYSEMDGLPKHAFCSDDCGNPEKWEKEFIDLDDNKKEGQKFGRDINLAIEGDVLHVSYRDIVPADVAGAGGTPGDDMGVLKYAKGEKNPNGPGWLWSQTIVEDTLGGVTDTYIAVSGGRIHISYRKVKDPSTSNSQDTIAYATCTTSCDLSRLSWFKINGDFGNDAGAPNHIVVFNNAIYISYYLDEEFWIATCTISSPDFCSNQATVPTDWTAAAIDDGFDEHGVKSNAGRENSLAVDATGIHVTYRVAYQNLTNDLKYTRCDFDLTCATPITIDPPNRFQENADVRVGGSSQIKIGPNGTLHVSYRDDANKDLMYAKCSSNCLTPGQWTVNRIDAPGDVGSDTYLEVEANGTVHISYRAAGDAGDLKYARGIP